MFLKEWRHFYTKIGRFPNNFMSWSRCAIFIRWTFCIFWVPYNQTDSTIWHSNAFSGQKRQKSPEIDLHKNPTSHDGDSMQHYHSTRNMVLAHLCSVALKLTNNQRALMVSGCLQLHTARVMSKLHSALRQQAFLTVPLIPQTTLMKDDCSARLGDGFDLLFFTGKMNPRNKFMWHLFLIYC